MKNTLLIVLGLLTAISAIAGDWKQVELKSQQGYDIQLNFQVRHVTSGAGTQTIAQPLWINVTRPGVGRVRAMLLNYQSGKTLASHLETDLVGRSNGHFTPGGGFIPDGTSSFAAEVQGGLLIDAADIAFTQEIAIVNERGEWQTDPISGGSNFKFSLNAAASGQ